MMMMMMNQQPARGNNGNSSSLDKHFTHQAFYYVEIKTHTENKNNRGIRMLKLHEWQIIEWGTAAI